MLKNGLGSKIFPYSGRVPVMYGCEVSRQTEAKQGDGYEFEFLGRECVVDVAGNVG